VSRKVRAIGHGIDLEEFPCVGARPVGESLSLLALGRYSEAKGLDVVVRAVADVADVSLHVYGPTLSAAERATRAELAALASRLGVGERVALRDAVPRSSLPALFRSYDALVNNMRAGAPDKVVFEAAASCLPVLASNPVFDRFLEPDQRFERDDPAMLADRIRVLASLSVEQRAELGRRLRERVRDGHSVESWARGVVEAAGLR
jgi:glycosyltransferase involved in cell wall biosynthesis